MTVRVPITVMGWRCERCAYEWIPRGVEEPRKCPRCSSARWNMPAAPLTYEAFRDAVRAVLEAAVEPLSWTEVRTAARIPLSFPVPGDWRRRIVPDTNLLLRHDHRGIVLWSLADSSDEIGTGAR